MNDANSTTTGLSFHAGHLDGWKADTEGQRKFRLMAVNILATLTGLDCATMDELRAEWCDAWPRAKQADSRLTSRGAKDKYAGDITWPSTYRPPVVRQLNEASDHVFKLRKLGLIAADSRLAVDMTLVRAKHAERYATWGVQNDDE